MADFFGSCFIFLTTGSVLLLIALPAVAIAVMDLVILADLLKRKTVNSYLVIMAVSFIVAIAYEFVGSHTPFWFIFTLMGYFGLPIFKFISIFHLSLDEKSEGRFARIFEGAVIVAFVPCVLGFLVTLSGLNWLISEPHVVREFSERLAR